MPSSPSASTSALRMARQKRLQVRAWDSWTVSLLPLGSLLFAIGVTTLLALWAQRAHMPLAPPLAQVLLQKAQEKLGAMGTGATGGGAGDEKGVQGEESEDEGEGEESAEEGKGEGKGGARKEQKQKQQKKRKVPEYSAPFLSDLLPETKSDAPKKKVLSLEEEKLAKAEAKYKHKLIQRSEMFDGRRPQPPFKHWNAGRVREVFLTATYACPQAKRFGSKERGKWLCFPSKLQGAPVVEYTFGALDDLSFEAALFRSLGPQTQIHVFTASLLPSAQQRLLSPKSEAREFMSSFHKVDLSGTEDLEEGKKEEGGSEKERMTLKQVLQKMGHSSVDILKVDCDGCEETVFPELAQKQVDRGQPLFKQLILEIHHARRASQTLPVIFALEDLGYRLFHVEPDSKSSQRYELGFVHESLLFPGSSGTTVSAPPAP